MLQRWADYLDELRPPAPDRKLTDLILHPVVRPPFELHLSRFMRVRALFHISRDAMQRCPGWQN